MYVRYLPKLSKGDCLEKALEKCKEILASQQPSQQTWADRMATLSENWSSCRRELFEAMVVREGLPSSRSCESCQTGRIAMRCRECGKTMCVSCDQAIHKDLPFHERDAFMDGFFQPIPPSSALDDNGFLIQIGIYTVHIYVRLIQAIKEGSPLNSESQISLMSNVILNINI